MKKIFLLTILVVSAMSFKSSVQERIVEQNSFTTGEHIEYRVHYGFVNAAEAIVDVDDKLQNANGRPCYKVGIVGRTVGVTDWISRVRDTWTSYIDASQILPQQFYMKKQEGNYRKEQRIIFNHNNNTAKLYELDDDQEKKNYTLPKYIQDVVSGYYFIRTIDFSKMNIGESVPVTFFFEGEVYNMRLKYRGKETISTKFGKINTFRITPQLPKNNFFEDEESVKMWVTDDENKIPVRAEVSLKIGALALDLRKYSGLKHELKFH
ncbi:DUF3108 domain-containing protein [Arcicella rigui]|uniref:DUF3108 domain-containing protein n=1 Tax=Arcicella rigui TaxID=797020 RepID=A0ABU5Q9Q1_9BACT|nr:DUF3108 domain-containing protein [Arcicella rigui]MEA5139576.1 DUF3108 domain-containing protein [Arcicella rigui]